jgi:hypothetical protein
MAFDSNSCIRPFAGKSNDKLRPFTRKKDLGIRVDKYLRVETREKGDFLLDRSPRGRAILRVQQTLTENPRFMNPEMLAVLLVSSFWLLRLLVYEG